MEGRKDEDSDDDGVDDKEPSGDKEEEREEDDDGKTSPPPSLKARNALQNEEDGEERDEETDDDPGDGKREEEVGEDHGDVRDGSSKVSRYQSKHNILHAMLFNQSKPKEDSSSSPPPVKHPRPKALVDKAAKTVKKFHRRLLPDELKKYVRLYKAAVGKGHDRFKSILDDIR